MSLIDEDFDGYSIGQIGPPMPWQYVPSQYGIVQVPGINPSPLRCLGSSPGFTFDIFQTTIPTSTVGPFIHIWVGFTIGSALSNLSGHLISMNNVNPLATNNRNNYLRIGIDANLGISLIGPGVGPHGPANYLIDPSTTLPANSVLQTGRSVAYGPWYFLEVNIKFTPIVQGDGSQTIGVAANTKLDGEAICSGSLDTGVLYLDSLGNPHTWTGFCDVNLFEFYSPSLGGQMDNITVTADANATSPLPHITIPNPTPPPPTLPVIPNARVSQGALEIVQKVSGSNVRVSQTVLEHVRRITSTKAILSQAVIELVAQNPNKPAGGWQIKEI
jgi:hypothetical protein